MAVVILNGAKRAWEEWNLRVSVLISLFLQILLISLTPSRKRTGYKVLTALIWSAYLLADWFAAFAIGLIFNGQGDDSAKSLRVNKDLAAFWAPFLLLHLGGPDEITAFSLEDNELWIRHLLGLVTQLVAVAYVFSKSISKEFIIPAVLMFCAGSIKYAERTRALYKASLRNFKSSVLSKPDAGPNYAQLMEEYVVKEAAEVPVKIETIVEHVDNSQTSAPPGLAKLEDELEILEQAYKFFKTFRGLVVDHMFSFRERDDSRDFFLRRYATDAFRIMEIELNFFYDTFYNKKPLVQKMAVVESMIWLTLRLICSVLIALSFEQFARQRLKLHIHHFDVIVTFILLSGAVVLDFVALGKLILSDWFIVFLKYPKAKSFLLGVRERLSFCNSFCKRSGRWSNKVLQHNLIKFSLKRRWRWMNIVADFFGLRDLLDEVQYKKSVAIDDDDSMGVIFNKLKCKNVGAKTDLEEMYSAKGIIFNELKTKTVEAKTIRKEIKEIYSAKGNRALSNYRDCYRKICDTVSEEVEYDESLLLWHIATELCYRTDTGDKIKPDSCPDTDDDIKPKIKRDFCKLISDYMLYLLVMRPEMMSAVAGIGQIRFQDTCEEAKKFFSTWKSELLSPVPKEKREAKQKEACDKLLNVNTVVKPNTVKGDRSKSVLFDACMLAKELKTLEDSERWEIMSKVWMELLSYASCHLPAHAHIRQLCNGGELITFVWLLMAHFGLGEQFRIEAGHARAKLIVGNSF